MKNLFHKIKIKIVTGPAVFKKGSGFYLVEQTDVKTHDLVYFNKASNLYFFLEFVDNVPKEILALFDSNEDKVMKAFEEAKNEPLIFGKVEKEGEEEKMVSESFVLKLMAVTRANDAKLDINKVLE